MRESKNPQPSEEEKDALIRSRSKGRADGGEFSNIQLLAPRVED